MSQGIIKCNEVWNIGIRKCLVKGTRKHRTTAFSPLDIPRPHCTTVPLRLQPSKCATSGNVVDKITQRALKLRTVEIILQALLQIYVLYFSVTEEVMCSHINC